MRRWILRVALALLVTAALAVAWRLREPVLLDRASLVGDTQDWGTTLLPAHWISDHRLLFLRQCNARQYDWQFTTHDYATGQETYLNALSRRVKNSGVMSFVLCFSPDARRIFWVPENAPECFVCSTDGSHMREFRRHTGSDIEWMEDSVHLVEYVPTRDGSHIAFGLVRDCDRPTLSRALILPANVPFRHDGITQSSSNHLLTVKWPGQDSPHRVETDGALVYDTITGQTNEPPRCFHIALPMKCNVVNGTFSTKGDRIAWALFKQPERPSLAMAWLQRRFPNLPLQARPKMSLWVSRLDGSRMHEIGFVVLGINEADQDGVLDIMQNLLFWQPDGKRLSFVLRGRLYTVPAD